MLKACCAAPPAEPRRRGAGQADGAPPEPRLTGIAMGKLGPEPGVDPLAFAQVPTATASAHSNFRAKQISYLERYLRVLVNRIFLFSSQCTCGCELEIIRPPAPGPDARLKRICRCALK